MDFMAALVLGLVAGFAVGVLVGIVVCRLRRDPGGELKTLRREVAQLRNSEQQAAEVLDWGREMYDRLRTFTNALNRATTSYGQRVLVQARRLEDLGLEIDQRIPELREAVGETPPDAAPEAD